MHEPEDCPSCDGSGFVVVWDTEGLADEDNCYCDCHTLVKTLDSDKPSG